MGTYKAINSPFKPPLFITRLFISIIAKGRLKRKLWHITDNYDNCSLNETDVLYTFGATSVKTIGFVIRT